MSDQDFLEGLRKADNSVLRVLYDRYLPAIVRLVENNSGGRDDALDVFQDALIVLHRKAKTDDFRLTSSLSTFLYAVCRNLWMKKLNKKSFSEVSIKDTGVYKSDEDLIDDLDKQEKYRLFKSKLNELTGNCKQILEMFLNGVDMKRIAEKLGLASVAYAKKRKFVCKEQLVKLIKNDTRYQELSTQ